MSNFVEYLPIVIAFVDYTYLTKFVFYNDRSLTY